jgi:uncharacterized protein (DUF433 family)
MWSMQEDNFGGETMNFPEFLVQDPDGHIHVAGRRIGLQDLVYYYNEGYSPEALLDVFSTLSLAEIHKVIAFYLDNRSEVDAYISACDLEMERQRAAAPRWPDAAELRRRLAARQAAGT